MLFTLLCGAFPFRANSEKELYVKITKGVFSCPEHLSQNVCELIRRILILKPTDRPNAEDVIFFIKMNKKIFLKKSIRLFFLKFLDYKKSI